MTKDPISGEWLTCAYCGKRIYGRGTIYCAEHRLPKSRKDEEGSGDYNSGSGYIREKQYNDRAVLLAWIIGISTILFFALIIFSVGTAKWKGGFITILLILAGVFFFIRWLNSLEERYKEKNKVKLIADSSKPKTNGLWEDGFKIAGVILLLVVLAGIKFNWSIETETNIVMISLVLVFAFLFFMRWIRRDKRNGGLFEKEEKKKINNKILLGLLIIFILGIIFWALINYNPNKLSENKNSNLNYISVSPLTVLENPGDYINTNLFLKDVEIIPAGMYPSGTLKVSKEDGTSLSLPYSYETPLFEDFKYDLYGTVLAESNPPEYWFKIDKVVQKAAKIH